MGTVVSTLRGKLTAASVKNARKRGYLGDGNGLYLQISPALTKSWVYRFRTGGKLREMGLGRYPTVSLAQARAAALKQTQARLSDVDPIHQRQLLRAQARLEASKAVTFQICAERFIESHNAAWDNKKHAKQWRSTLKTYAYPVFGDLPVQQVDDTLVMDVIRPIWSEKPETASRVRARIEKVLSWAIASKLRSEPNPARWKGHIEIMLPRKSKVRRVEHHPALPYKEIGDFLEKLRRQDGVGASALEFLILTAARTNEVLGARWDEIDLDSAIWKLPASRMKARKEHHVPLTESALAVVARMQSIRRDEFIFPGGKKDKPLSNMAMLTLLRRMDRADITAHGFRSTFRDWASEQTSFESRVAEAALAHTISNSVEAAYHRTDLFDKRRQMMDMWAQFCARPAPTNFEKILPFRTPIKHIQSH